MNMEPNSPPSRGGDGHSQGTRAGHGQMAPKFQLQPSKPLPPGDRSLDPQLVMLVPSPGAALSSPLGSYINTRNLVSCIHLWCPPPQLRIPLIQDPCPLVPLSLYNKQVTTQYEQYVCVCLA